MIRASLVRLVTGNMARAPMPMPKCPFVLHRGCFHWWRGGDRTDEQAYAAKDNTQDGRSYRDMGCSRQTRPVAW